MISIVVPVYKVEKYLDRCVQSLLNQTYQNIEIILVDDGSPDKCPKMCDAYAYRYSQIRVVHKENGGLSSARNAGIKAAAGKYIGFVDSDDDVDSRMYEIMCNILIQESVDFVMCDYTRIQEDRKYYLKTTELRGGRFNKKEIEKEIFPQLIMGKNLDYGPLLSVWHCLYKSEFLKKHHLLFDEEVRWSEDNIFSAFVGYYADSFYYLKGQGLYHYYCNPGTITTSYREGSWDVYCIMNKHIHDFFDRVVEYDFSYQMKLHMIYYACNSLGQIKISNKNRKEKAVLRKRILHSQELREAFKDFCFPCWNWKLKLQVGLIKLRMGWALALL